VEPPPVEKKEEEKSEEKSEEKGEKEKEKEEEEEEEPYYVCEEEECIEKAKIACAKRHPDCHHLCGGILHEEVCLPCLHEDCFEKSKESGKYGELTQEGSDYCNVCWVEEISSSPSIHLVCGHIFHYKCILDRIKKRWPGPTISFTFCECPLCNKLIEHPSVQKEVDLIKEFKKFVFLKRNNRSRDSNIFFQRDR
jgi:E3 ubiquitin-protein ligase MYCBP2